MTLPKLALLFNVVNLNLPVLTGLPRGRDPTGLRQRLHLQSVLLPGSDSGGKGEDPQSEMRDGSS